MKNTIRNKFVATLTFAVMATALSGCLLHEEGEESAYDEYSVESGELAAGPAHMVGKKVAISGVKNMKVFNWTATVEAADVKVSTCSDSWHLNSICSGTNGKSGSIGVPGPDGGTCTIKGTYQNCAVSDGCCTCDLVEESREGDCADDGSKGSVMETMTEDW